MALQTKTKHKIDFANTSDRGARRLENNDSFGKFPYEHSNLETTKGQLFLIADAKSRNPLGGKDAGKMAVNIIQQNYFAYPSDDVAFSIQRAFDTANRYIYQYAQANSIHKRIGTTCSALILTDKAAFVAHVGDCRIYRISVRKIEKLTQDHSRTIEFRDANDRPSVRPVLTRALGVKLGVKVDAVNRTNVHRDEYFVLCTDGIRNVREQEIKNVVLSSSPQQACRKLIQLARQRGSSDDATVQIIKVYNDYQEPHIETYSHVTHLTNTSSNAPIYMILAALFFAIGYIGWEPLKMKAGNVFGDAVRTISVEENRDLSLQELEVQQMMTARYHLDAKNFDEALKIYRTVLRNNPAQRQAENRIMDIAQLFHEQGDQAYRKRNWRAALDAYTHALGIDRENRELARRIVALEKQVGAKRYTRKAVSNNSIPTLTVRESENVDNFGVPQARMVAGINQVQWDFPGLYQGDDFSVQNNYITFYENITRKKAFHLMNYDRMEMETQVNVLRGKRNGRYGFIFGNTLDDNAPYQDFYLFTIDTHGHLMLQRIMGNKVKTLVSEPIRRANISDYSNLFLKLKVLGNLAILSANGEPLKMIPLEEEVSGGIGLYVDPKLRVEFSRFKIKPSNGGI